MAGPQRGDCRYRRICTGKSLITDDPLGLGGLLTGACKIAQLVIADNFTQPDLLETVAASSLIGLDSYVREGLFETSC